MLTPVYSSRLKHDITRLKRQGKDLRKLRRVITLLATETPLPPTYRDHMLKGSWVGFRDCHVEPDWVLIYAIRGGKLHLSRTGTHADILGD
jgi:mRNA interferase YafQ